MTSVVRLVRFFAVSTCFTINMAINMERRICKQNQTQNHKMPQFGCFKESDMCEVLVEGHPYDSATRAGKARDACINSDLQ